MHCLLRLSGLNSKAVMHSINLQESGEDLGLVTIAWHIEPHAWNKTRDNYRVCILLSI